MEIANFETIAGLYPGELSGLGHFALPCDRGMGHMIWCALK